MKCTLVIGVITILLISCSKDKTINTSTGQSVNSGTYTFKGLTYTAKLATRFNESLSVQDYSGPLVPPANSNVVFWFATFPTASATYQIVPGGNAPTSPGQMSILFGGSDYSYNYFGASSISGTAQVTVDSVGKLSIVISSPVTLVGQGVAYDSAGFTASVHQ